MNWNPESFDIAGLIVFAIVLSFGLLIKYKRRELSKNVLDGIAVTLILIGILGILVDATIVFIKMINV